MSDYAVAAADSRADHQPLFKLALAAGLAALADSLFYEQSLGLSVVVFTIALAVAAVTANHMLIARTRFISAGAIFVAGLLPAVEELTTLSFVFVVLGSTTAIALLTDPQLKGLRAWLTDQRQLLAIGPFRLLPDAAKALSGPGLTRGLVVWFVPLVLGAAFVLLFAQANPVIEEWLSDIHSKQVTASFSPLRTLFWIAAASLVWPFVALRWRHKPARVADVTEPAGAAGETSSGLADLFGPPAILRSLILFNLLFAVQTALDIIYLWGHAALPAGMTYAAYAHRGAYPLILTALLAAGFVLIAIRPGQPATRQRVIRPLVYLWIGQNLMLVLSSLLRLKLYVDIYLLSYWRISAAIWMGLVMAGLILILIRIVQNRSHRWLIRMNLIALVATLYVCSLINFDAIIANYNVTHSQEAGGRGVSVDSAYLASLGPQAIPALAPLETNPYAAARLDILREQQVRNMSSWRSWSFRGWRLQRYVDKHPPSSAPN